MTTSDTPAAAGQPANSPEDLKLVQAYAAWLASKRFVFLSGEAQPIKAETGERRFYVVHPSRTAPLCKDCQHVGVLGDSSMRFQMCNHPTAPRCVVNGTPERRADSARNPGRPCGPDGALFEPISDTPATFAQLWLSGGLPLPVAPCTAEQLYRAYRHWCDRTNAKWPPDQACFTAAVKKAQPQLRYAAHQLLTPNMRCTKRVWLPGYKPIDAEALTELVAQFDEALQAYTQRTGLTSV